MIKIGFDADTGTYKIALVLEPENFDRLRAGEMIEVNLNELCDRLPFFLTLALDYTPDAIWMEQEAIRRNITTAAEFRELLEESQPRPEVRKRPYHPPHFFHKGKSNS